MEKTLKEKCYDWILNAIQSSNNPFHIDGCKKLIELFKNKFGDPIMEADLENELILKENTINYI
jgi:hypothetical protein